MPVFFAYLHNIFFSITTVLNAVAVKTDSEVTHNPLLRLGYVYLLQKDQNIVQNSKQTFR